MRRSLALWPTLVMVGAALSGCSGEILNPTNPTVPPPTAPPPTTPPEPPPPTTPPPPPPPVTPPPGPTEIPVDVPELSATVDCVDHDAGEHIAAVSPEGHLWTVVTSSQGAPNTRFRVFDAWNPTEAREINFPWSQVDAFAAYSSTTAAAVADGALWFVQDGDRIAVSFPSPLTGAVSFCGDLSDQAFVYADGQLFERSGEDWFSWTGINAAFESGTVLRRDGACYGADDGVWFSAAGGEFWRLSATQIARPAALETAEFASIRENDIFALSEGNLFIGPEPWEELTFVQGDADLLAAAGAYAWIMVDGLLYRFGSDFMKLSTMDVDVAALHPHASGGLWIETAEQFCHVTPSDMIRVKDVVNGQITTDDTLDFGARSAEGDLQAFLGEVELSPISQADGWSNFRVPLALGWQSIELTGPAGVRRVAVKRLPGIERSFAVDIAPVYNEHCASCHADGALEGAPTIDTYEAWIARSTKLLERVVRSDDMPPSASRLPSWTSEQVEVINEWITGGMKP